MKRRLFKTMAAVLAIAAAAAGPAWGQISKVSWVLTPYGDLQTGDTVVIVDKTSACAMPNNGIGSAPSAVAIGLNSAKDSLTGTPAATLQWVVVLDNGDYMFQVPGTSNYLYCTNNNNGVRVGDDVDGDDKKFTFVDNQGYYDVPFLRNIPQARYIGVYNNQDWRCYGNTSNNIKNTVIGFYKKTVTIIPTHTVRMAAGTEEAANWTLASGDASVQGTAVLENVMSGSEVTATYNGTRKVKSVKAVKYVPPVLVESIVLDKQTASLAKDSTMTLSVASVLPENAADKSYSWSSDNTSVATVNENGVVTGVAGGTANIIATANDGSGVKDTCVVTVIALQSLTLDGVAVLYASDGDNWSTIMGYNPGVIYQDDDKVRLTSNDAFLFYYGNQVLVTDFIYPFSNDDYQWLHVIVLNSSSFFYHQGETWQEAIDAGRSDNFIWSIDGNQVIYNGSQTVVDANNEPVDPEATIDPSTVYGLVGW